MTNINLKIKTKTQNYSILIGANLTKNISNILKKNSIKFTKCLIVVDKNVPKEIISSIKKSLNSKNIYIFFLKLRK